MRNWGLVQRTARVEQSRRLRAINPETPPDRVLGDVGFHPIDLDDLDQDATAWCIDRLAKVALSIVLAFAAITLLLILLARWALAQAHDDGRYAGSPLKPWFDQLASGKGLCCSFADGRTVADPDWGTDAHGYWVVVDGVKFDVPSEAVVTVPNKFGQAVVWPYPEYSSETGAMLTKIRCFMPGAGL